MSTWSIPTCCTDIVNNAVMDTRRLALLVDLERLGSMRAVAAERGITTSTVSQQIAALSQELGVPVTEPDGRRVRLTPAGRRLVEHAHGILGAIDTALRDIDPDAEPAGVVRIAGFASAIATDLVPIVGSLGETHPMVQLHVSEFEPRESLALLAGDEADLALVYDYNLAPAVWPPGLTVHELRSVRFGLGVFNRGPSTPQRLVDHAHSAWVVNSRHGADEQVVRTLTSIAGFLPRVEHRIDSLDLVEDLIAANLGVGLLPETSAEAGRVRILPLEEPCVVLRTFAATRRGREQWPPIRLVIDLLVAHRSHLGTATG